MEKSAYYRRLVLKELYFSQELSCADLSQKIGKSLPFISKVLSELIASGHATESGYAPSSGGRRATIYKLKPDTAFILSVAMDQLSTRLCLLDLHNKAVGEPVAVDLSLHNNPHALQFLVEEINKMLSASKVDKRKIVGIGVGMPGFIDVRKGVNYSFFYNGEQVVTSFLAECTGLPVYIDNDSSLIALAELKFGAARNLVNAMVINIGWGVGLGMVLNGQLFRGHNGFAGEFSHMPLFSNNKLCACGKSGCLETETSLLVIIEKAITELKKGKLSSLAHDFPSGNPEKDYKAIIHAALKGDQFAIELLAELGYNIGKGLAILIHLLNPESIILSGRGAIAGKMLQTPIQQALNKDCIPRLSASTVVSLSTLGDDAGLIGAAALVMESNARDIIKTKSKTGVRRKALLPDD
jgi:predicted NBD/HSP70 family sugar kinase